MGIDIAHPRHQAGPERVGAHNPFHLPVGEVKVFGLSKHRGRAPQQRGMKFQVGHRAESVLLPDRQKITARQLAFQWPVAFGRRRASSRVCVSARRRKPGVNQPPLQVAGHTASFIRLPASPAPPVRKPPLSPERACDRRLFLGLTDDSCHSPHPASSLSCALRIPPNSRCIKQKLPLARGTVLSHPTFAMLTFVNIGFPDPRVKVKSGWLGFPPTGLSHTDVRFQREG